MLAWLLEPKNIILVIFALLVTAHFIKSLWDKSKVKMFMLARGAYYDKRGAGLEAHKAGGTFSFFKEGGSGRKFSESYEFSYDWGDIVFATYEHGTVKIPNEFSWAEIKANVQKTEVAVITFDKFMLPSVIIAPSFFTEGNTKTGYKKFDKHYDVFSSIKFYDPNIIVPPELQLLLLKEGPYTLFFQKDMVLVILDLPFFNYEHAYKKAYDFVQSTAMIINNSYTLHPPREEELWGHAGKFEPFSMQARRLLLVYIPAFIVFCAFVAGYIFL